MERRKSKTATIFLSNLFSTSIAYANDIHVFKVNKICLTLILKTQNDHTRYPLFLPFVVVVRFCCFVNIVEFKQLNDA